MAGTFKFELVSPERVLLSVEAEEVVLPGSEGEFAVLAGHAPVIAMLLPGILSVVADGTRKRIFVRGGFAEVLPDQLTVLAQFAFDADEADTARIEAEKANAQEQLALASGDEALRQAQAGVDSLNRLRAG